MLKQINTSLSNCFLIVLLLLSTNVMADDRLVGSWLRAVYSDITDCGAVGYRIEKRRDGNFDFYRSLAGVSTKLFTSRIHSDLGDNRGWLIHKNIIDIDIIDDNYYAVNIGDNGQHWLENWRYYYIPVGGLRPDIEGWDGPTWSKPSSTQIPLPWEPPIQQNCPLETCDFHHRCCGAIQPDGSCDGQCVLKQRACP